MGDLIKGTSYSEITATIELFDRLGVTSEHLAILRKASSWQQATTAGVISGDPYLLALLSIEVEAKKAGIKPEHLKRVSADKEILRGFRDVLAGLSEIKPIENIIDTDAGPWLPNENWWVEEHRRGGIFGWNPAEQAKPECQYLSREQQRGRVTNGNDLREELADKPVLNANVLDWLLKKENQRFIPEEWKDGKARFFWGTIYRDPAGRLYVRCLVWNGGVWGWGWGWLECVWSDRRPAVLRASSSVLLDS